MWDTYIIIPMTNVLLWIYESTELIGFNFGIAIILFTILIRAITWPLTAQQLKGTQGMQELQKDKEWLSIQKKNKNDKEKLAQEQMRIYKERGINPFGSCLPTLIQFPVIIGLYQSIIRSLAATPLSLLNMSRSLYSFLDVSKVIPLNSKFLWMDLGRPESLEVFGFALPTLAVVVVITSYIQSKLMTPPSNPGDQSAAMGNMMSIYMPFLMGYFAMTFASGLALYFITSNLLGIAQYAMMGKANWSNLIPGRK
ncbi:MAG: membrane protein insertase YidC [Anaerolineales bacterium]|uniref:Membrane protein insertase YidC n=1 Tax=Candidatus Desulfolinea nitratireducens TaxID=2841698 RepID=A0A8J6TF64_9CHLR|nr:membrane protein insertase YidC [Candidatus Desulfolinea nitratireducens]MBL6960128.1 membrane protein insertase YidC [Anaerolineales bacterium]